jgi:hypothetical protein
MRVVNKPEESITGSCSLMFFFFEAHLLRSHNTSPVVLSESPERSLKWDGCYA